MSACRVRSPRCRTALQRRALEPRRVCLNSRPCAGASAEPKPQLSEAKIPPLTLPGVDMTDEYNYYYLVLVVTILVVAFSLLLANTTLGHRFRAMRDDNLAAAAAGIEIPYYRLMAFVLSGLLCGVAGVLYAQVH